MKTKKAFTLIELLVVIAIIALLLSIIMPALKLAKAKAMELSSLANMRSLTMAWLLYTENNDSELISGQVWMTNNKNSKPPHTPPPNEIDDAQYMHRAYHHDYR